MTNFFYTLLNSLFSYYSPCGKLQPKSVIPILFILFFSSLVSLPIFFYIYRIYSNRAPRVLFHFDSLTRVVLEAQVVLEARVLLNDKGKNNTILISNVYLHVQPKKNTRSRIKKRTDFQTSSSSSTIISSSSSGW